MSLLKKQLDRKTFSAAENRIEFQAYGVKISIEAESSAYLDAVCEQLAKVFPHGLAMLGDGQPVEYRFLIESRGTNRIVLYRNEELIIEDASEDNFFEFFETQIRITIAEFAVDKVFLHAGVVGWKGKAIIIPAISFSGKTTLVAALVKQGAEYYSDEYAVLDADGNVEPFPKWLSMRGIIDDFTQLDCPVESLGGVAGIKTIPVGMVLISKFEKGKKTPRKWKPEKLSDGQAIMEILPHTLPIRNKPEFVLKVLNKMVSRAIIIKSVRGEAAEFAEPLLSFFETETA